MAKTVELVDLVITNMKIDYEALNVVVSYALVDIDGVRWSTGLAYFWVNLPPIEPMPINYFLLPPDYIPLLVGLRDDADGALTAKFLG